MSDTKEVRKKIEDILTKESVELAQHMCGFCGETIEGNPGSETEGTDPHEMHNIMVFTMAMGAIEAIIRSHVMGDETLQKFASEQLFRFGAFCMTGEEAEEVTIKHGMIGPNGEIMIGKDDKVVH